MIVTDKSSIITFAVPVFFVLIIIEYLYGRAKGKNTYRLNDTFTSIVIGMISRYPTMLNLGFQSAVFIYISTSLNMKLMPTNSVLTWVIAFLLYDLSYYWMHRMHHEIKILWATHSVHHHGEDFNLATALRQTSTGWLWKWVFYLPMILIGVPAEVFISVAGVNLVYQFWVHTKHIGHLGILEKIFITPMNHSVHHAKNKEYIDANYGGVFIIWDRMFGTYIAELPDVKPVYGTVTPLNSFNPIWANFQIFSNMFKDSLKTKKFRDKLKVWVAPTYWKPEDLREEKPQHYDKNNIQEKFNPVITTDMKIFSFVQMLSIIFVSGSVLLFSQSLAYVDIAIFGVLMVLFSTLNSRLLENKNYSYALLLFFSIMILIGVNLFNLMDISLMPVQILMLHMITNIGIILIIQLAGLIKLDPVRAR